jgi:DNA repair protein RecN (Recombination protein N)
MLVHLRIQNLAVIEEASIPFGPGLNIVTGETGAGKSIVAQALHIILGERAKNDWIRRGAKSGEVEALFRFAPDYPLVARLKELEWLSEDEGQENVEVLIRRVLSTSGRGRVFVNGHLTTVALLAELMRGVIDRTDQHAHTLLTHPRHQLTLLDRFAGSREQTQAFESAYTEYSKAQKELVSLEKRVKERMQQEDFLRFQLHEFDEIAPEPDEEDALRARRGKLAHASALVETALEVEQTLTGGGQSIASLLVDLERKMASSVALDPSIAPILERLEASRIDLEDVSFESRRYADGLDSDPYALDGLEERLFKLEKLRRRFGPDWENVFEHFEQVRDDLAEVDDADHRLDTLRAEVTRTHKEALSLARRLSTTRQAAARVLEEEITRELSDLAMDGARLEFALTPLEHLAASGLDDIDVRIATNHGDSLRPIEKVASGGERSRVLLALKGVLADANEVPIAIFDEIDSGVGGMVAESVGRKLRTLSHSGQVLAITHLAPVAAMGHIHHVVEKRVLEGRASTSVRTVEGEKRLEEIARMLGGHRDSRGATDHARDLLQLSQS